MSVINQMLKDLAAQKAQGVKQSQWLQDVGVNRCERREFAHLGWWLVGICLLMVMGMIGLHYRGMYLTVSTTPKPSIVQKSVPSAIVMPIPLPAPIAEVAHSSASIAPTPLISNQNHIKPASAQIRQASLHARYEKAMQALSLGDSAAGLATLKAILKSEPRFHAARLALIVEALRHNELQSVADLLTTGRSMDRHNDAYIRLQAELYVKQLQLDKAIAVLESESPDMVSHTSYYSLLAGLYLQTKQIEKAVMLYETLLSFDQSQSLWWMGLGLALSAEGHVVEARDAFKKALETGQLSVRLRDFVQSKLNESA